MKKNWGCETTLIIIIVMRSVNCCFILEIPPVCWLSGECGYRTSGGFFAAKIMYGCFSSFVYSCLLFWNGETRWTPGGYECVWMYGASEPGNEIFVIALWDFSLRRDACPFASLQELFHSAQIHRSAGAVKANFASIPMSIQARKHFYSLEILH